MGCELAIVGGGPAGMAAAATAASLDLDTVLLDEQSEPGGQIYRGIEAVQRNRAGDLKVLGEEYAEGAALAEAFRASGCAYEPGSTVWQARGDGVIGMSRGGASRMLPAQCILLATGAMERPVPIPGWTLPGVMGAGAAQSLLKAPGLVPDGPVVIVGAGPLIYLIAAQFVRASVPIAAGPGDRAGNRRRRCHARVAGRAGCRTHLAERIGVAERIARKRRTYGL